MLGKLIMLSFPRREKYIADRKNIMAQRNAGAIWIGLSVLLKLLQEGQCWFFLNTSGVVYSWCTSSLFGSIRGGTVVTPCLWDKLVLHSPRSFFMLHYQFCFFIAVLQFYKQWMSLAVVHKLLHDVTVSRFLHEKLKEKSHAWLFFLFSLFTSHRKNITFHGWCSHGLRYHVYQVFQQEEVEPSSWAIGVLLARWVFFFLKS